MQAGSQAERAGEWRTRQSAFRSSALTEVGAVVLQRAEAMCSDGDYAGARTLLALELPLPMGLSSHDATQQPDVAWVSRWYLTAVCRVATTIIIIASLDDFLFNITAKAVYKSNRG